MGFRQWLRGFWSSSQGEEAAAEHEEYGRADRVDRDRERARLGSFAGSEESSAANAELNEFKAPRDPAP